MKVWEVMKMAEKQDQEKIENEKNYVKNYFILAVLFLACFGLTIYFCKWYDVYKEYQKEVPVIRGSMLEIYSDDLEHYLVDNPNSIIYMCTAYSDVCRQYEKKLKKYLTKNDAIDNLVYLNLTNEDSEKFLEKFNQKYPYRISLKGNYPSFVVFENGVVEKILQGTSQTPLSITKTQSFLEFYMVEEEASIEEELAKVADSDTKEESV